ncbi:hypothetical protein H8L32_00140 [Undibacterium sp. CY18W]|uniref:Uncharacterized protein n=1 Tax=Undibacterium hunanense TaxID=2762292 RepID=A0ABR6ZK10_9BURK|nr:hypothetical protein [Undibacterium hunanense]MBC3915878.1 hypothetical protein [Undibacterium hunanense]
MQKWYEDNEVLMVFQSEKKYFRGTLPQTNNAGLCRAKKTNCLKTTVFDAAKAVIGQ